MTLKFVEHWQPGLEPVINKWANYKYKYISVCTLMSSGPFVTYFDFHLDHYSLSFSKTAFVTIQLEIQENGRWSQW